MESLCVKSWIVTFGNEYSNSSIWRAMVLGQPLHTGSWSLRLVPKVPFSFTSPSPYIPHHHHRVLVVGCGNSGISLFLSYFTWFGLSRLIDFAAFSEGMVDDGYEDVVNIDISSVVIEAMQKKYSNRPHLKCMYLLFIWINLQFYDL